MAEQSADDFNTDPITECIDTLIEMSETAPEEVKRIVNEEFEAHMPAPRHMRPFAEEWSEVAESVGLVK